MAQLKRARVHADMRKGADKQEALKEAASGFSARLGRMAAKGVAVAGVSGLIVAALVGGAARMQDGHRVGELIADLAQVQQAVGALYAGQPDFSTVSTQGIAGVLPARLAGNGAPRHSLGGAIEVSRLGDPKTYMVRFHEVGGGVCEGLVTRELGQNVVAVSVDVDGVPRVAGLGRPLSGPEAGKHCGAAGAAVTWILR